jgi:D-methionine transport system substrate-binding protein
MKNIKLVVIGLLVLALGILSACASSDTNENNVVKLGINGAETEIWTYMKEVLAKDGITLEIVSFGDYVRPNLSLAEGEIDLNAFQHYAYFDKFKAEHKLDLTAIGETVIAPIGLYSNKIKNVSELKSGDKIAIPNDETNGGRTLILLQTAGLIKIDPAVANLPTLKDITENTLELEIVEVDASTTPRILDDVAVAAINSTFAVDSGLLPTEDSIFLEPVNENSKPFINIIASKTADKDNESYKKVVEAYQTDEVEKILMELYKGSQVRAW